MDELTNLNEDIKREESFLEEAKNLVEKMQQALSTMTLAYNIRYAKSSLVDFKKTVTDSELKLEKLQLKKEYFVS
jgi:hypothetical protein